MAEVAAEPNGKEAVDWRFWGLFLSAAILLMCCVLLTQRNKTLRENLVSVRDTYLDTMAIKVGDRLPGLEMVQTDGQRFSLNYGADQTWRMIHINALDCAASNSQTNQWWEQLNMEPAFTDIQKVMVTMRRTPDAGREFDPTQWSGLVVEPEHIRAFHRGYRLLQTPTFLLVSPMGEVKWTFVGVFTDEDYGTLVETVMAHQPLIASAEPTEVAAKKL